MSTTDYRTHPDSTVTPPVSESIVPDTGICGTFRQVIYTCELCGRWSMDHRLFLTVIVSNRTGYQCTDFSRCMRTQGNRAS